MRFWIVFVPALALLTQSQTPPDARSLLMRSGGSILMADTVRLEGTESREVVLPGGSQTLTESIKLERSTGGRMRLETKSPNNTGLQIADGQYVWTYSSGSRTYTKTVQSNDPANDAPIFKVEPEYSKEARQAKLQGSKLLYIQVSPNGRATSMDIVKPLGMGMDEKAMEAVKRWRFKPGTKDGEPVTVEATVEINFKLL